MASLSDLVIAPLWWLLWLLLLLLFILAIHPLSILYGALDLSLCFLQKVHV